MLGSYSCRFRRFLTTSLTSGLLLAFGLTDKDLSAQVLVGNAFASPSSGWVNAFPYPTRLGDWRLSLHNPTMMNTNDSAVPATGGGTNTGLYEPDVLVQNDFLAPSTYDYTVTMRQNDDDIIGLVWNYQDPNNYFRVGIRQQAAGTFGGTQGLSVQKIVGGVLTQLIPSTIGPGPASPITQTMITDRELINMKVAVNGSNYEIFFNNVSVGSGSDAALVAGRKVGFQSWAQLTDTTSNPYWGAEFESASVAQGANTLFSQTFDARPTKWRQLIMTNSAGATGLSATAPNKGDILGNFGNSVGYPAIHQHSNGSLSATATTPNIDFLGASVVVDDPGSANFTNYEMRTRIGAADNDGVGVLLRVQSDNTFYRVNFVNEGPLATTTRPPAGMSVQKCLNGVWTELYREPGAPLFTYVDNGPAGNGSNVPTAAGYKPFDLKVGLVGDTLKIQVKDDTGNVINYPLITDPSNPILTGTVGLTTYGTTDVFYMGYGGLDTPMLRTLTSLKDIDVTIDRATGQMKIVNNDPTLVDIKGVSLQSPGGAMLAGSWLSIANNYDKPSAPTPGDGSVDPNDAWTVVSNTVFNLNEAEQVGNGGTLGASGEINLGNAWKKSRVEDVVADLVLADGSTVSMDVVFTGTSNGRADLNANGVVDANDWPLFYPNMLTNMSGMTLVQKALAGDLDGDGDNDLDDFVLFKTDYDVANGAGAFSAMAGAVPEPTSCMLLIIGTIGAFALRRRRSSKLLIVALGASAVLIVSGTASATAVDLTTFTVEAYPPSNTFLAPVWTPTPSKVTVTSGSDAAVNYASDSALNKRYIGLITPGTDDDVVGFVVGFEPGDAQINSTADYLIIDWKGVTQGFDFSDQGAVNFHHDSTPTGSMPIGLGLSRVTGSPTGDEMWQHADLVGNPSGGVVELARGATLGSSAYNRANGSHVFDIRYTATNVTVLIDGVEQFNQNGSFPDGRFGLYTAYQGPSAPSFSNIEVVPATGFDGLSATVDRDTGEIILKNTGMAVVDFDYYQIASTSGSLNKAGWNSISEQGLLSAGAGPGQSWAEAGGSSDSALVEVNLAALTTVAGTSQINLGTAYDFTQDSQDVVLTYRLLSGLVLTAELTYIGGTTPGDFNEDGFVDAADYVVWRKNPGNFPPNAYDTWRANFGNPPGSGSSLGGNSQVPEPATIGLVLFAGLALVARRAAGGRNR
jgi:hypothetical protein